LFEGIAADVCAEPCLMCQHSRNARSRPGKAQPWAH